MGAFARLDRTQGDKKSVGFAIRAGLYLQPVMGLGDMAASGGCLEVARGAHADRLEPGQCQGRPVALQSIHSFVNGLSAPFAGENCFRVASSSCARVLLVTDDSVRAAMRVLTAEFRLLVESSGAAPLAALCALQKEELEGKSVCLVISGGNISIDELSSILSTKVC